ncbi:MAG TPA: hypothetical protein PKU97_08705, partial [Kofleriaceae bacterium]|nr:hypothetical protein [Kofleriaceae bacterium]
MAKRSPILGYNHNVRYRGLVFHVQTEDSGVLAPHVFTHMFHGGVILSTRKLVYDAGASEDVIRSLMQAQHKAVLKELRRGTFDDKIEEYLGSNPDLLPRGSGESAPEIAVVVEDPAGVDLADAQAGATEPIPVMELPLDLAPEPAPAIEESSPVESRADTLPAMAPGMSPAESRADTLPVTSPVMSSVTSPVTSVPPPAEAARLSAEPVARAWWLPRHVR